MKRFLIKFLGVHGKRHMIAEQRLLDSFVVMGR